MLKSGLAWLRDCLFRSYKEERKTMIDDLIRKYEGCCLVAYPDPATGGLPVTIGWGSTKKPDGSNFAIGEEISQEVADMLLDSYIKKNIEPVFDKIPYKLSDNQRCALASLMYNIGVPAFTRSNLFKSICSKDVEGIFNKWDWIKGGGKVMKGLAKRRSEELYLFLKDL